MSYFSKVIFFLLAIFSMLIIPGACFAEAGNVSRPTTVISGTYLVMNIKPPELAASLPTPVAGVLVLEIYDQWGTCELALDGGEPYLGVMDGNICRITVGEIQCAFDSKGAFCDIPGTDIFFDFALSDRSCMTILQEGLWYDCPDSIPAYLWPY